jgi:hypothetical protein
MGYGDGAAEKPCRGLRDFLKASIAMKVGGQGRFSQALSSRVFLRKSATDAFLKAR